MTLGDKIRFHRKAMGLTQTELGEKLGVKVNAVSKWECGRVEDIPTSKIKALAKLFGVLPSYLIDDDVQPTENGEVPINISKKLYNLRIDKGLTQADMGKIAGVSDKTISSWESGNRCPKIVPYVQNICKHFHLDMLTFIDEETDNMGYHAEQPTETDGLTEKDVRLVEWFHSLPEEKQKAILSLAGAPEDLAE